MPAKKAAAKKNKKTGSTKKTAGKTSRKKTSASRSTVASRKKVTKRSAKKASAKKVSTKKASAKKTSAKKTSAKKKTAAKKAGAKKAGKSTGASRKKGTSKKAPTKKAAAKKKTAARKKPASKKKSSVSKKKPVSKKKVVAKPASSRKKTPVQPTTGRGSSAAKSAEAPRASVLSGPVRGFQPYQPKRGEPYMSDEQLEHFRHILLAWKRELMEEVDRTVLHMKDDAANFPDPNDRATQESEFGLELRTRDRERKLLKKIDSALQRIEDKTYGYCEETGDEIGLRRLEARPVATLCVEAQERRELAERQFRDREDYYR
jgi:DnaK suppressor protein